MQFSLWLIVWIDDKLAVGNFGFELVGEQNTDGITHFAFAFIQYISILLFK